MSNFPFAWWDKTVTIYNKVVDPTNQRVTWYRNTVENCFWKSTNTLYTLGRYGMSSLGVQLETKDVICRIPQDDRFVDRKTWREMKDTDRKDHFTLCNGDIVVLGEVEDVIDDYTPGQRSTDIVAKYKEDDACIEVETYVDNVQTGVGLAHYRVVGR